MSNEVISNTNAISFDWTDVTSATKYWIQVSKSFLDFRATLVSEDNNLATSDHSFTATGNGKYYYRWKPYISTWQAWREVGSFIVNTSASADVSATSWTLVNKTDITDVYVLENQPLFWREIPEHFWEAFRRNRKGNLRSQHFVTKGRIELDISRSFLGANQKAEILRFFNAHTSFYLVTKYNNQLEDDFIYRAYEVVIPDAPNVDTAGGNTIIFSEV